MKNFARHSLLLAIMSALAVDSQITTQAESFGINFLGNATAQTVTGSAGMVAIPNWNNITNTTFITGSIHSSDGTASATLSVSGGDRLTTATLVERLNHPGI